MGNIADALKKAGVELEDQPQAQAGIDAVEEAPTEPCASKEQGSEVVNTARARVDRLQISLNYGSWNERIKLVMDNDGSSGEAFRVLRSKILFPKDG